MTQLETPHRPKEDRDPGPRSSSSNPSTSSPFWWIALSVTCVALIVAAIAFAVGLSNSGSERPQVFADTQVPVRLTDFRVSVPAAQMTAGVKTLQINNGGVPPEPLRVQPNAP